MKITDIDIINIIINELDYLCENTSNIDLKHLINKRKWVLVNILYNYNEAKEILTSNWQNSYNYRNTLSEIALLDIRISMLLTSRLSNLLDNNRCISDRVIVLKKVLDNFDENVLVLQEKGFFANHDCIKRRLKIVDNCE